MDEVKLLLEYCFLASKIDGGKINLENLEIPLVGIKGLGEEFERNGKKNVWIAGEILSPNFIGNNACSCKSHIEGFVSDHGKMRLLESVYDFPVFEGSCYEYNLDFQRFPKSEIPNSALFKGDVYSRLYSDNFQKKDSGEIYLSIIPNWERGESGKSAVPCLSYGNMRIRPGLYIPKFWNEFLEEIEDEGYDHPYGAITEELKKEREEKKSNSLFDNRFNHITDGLTF
jgi:hypothetical protein